jgi:hypothetical protein
LAHYHFFEQHLTVVFSHPCIGLRSNGQSQACRQGGDAMLKLGTMVDYAGQVGRIVARTIELHPKYDIMLANGTIRSNVRESDLVVRRQPGEQLADSRLADSQPTRGTLASSGEAAMSMQQAEPTTEGPDAGSDRRG